MPGLVGSDGAPRYARRAVVWLVLLIKVGWVVAILILLQLGAGYFGFGTGALAAHVIVVAIVAGILFLGPARHRRLVDGQMRREGDQASGIVLHGAAGYDLLARILTFGREGSFRESLLRPAAIRPGEAVLDVACGTGTLAIAAKKHAGGGGSVTGIDASPEMIDRARAKAERAGVEVTFATGTAQSLPFDNGHFDIVMGTLMLHHLPKPVRAAFAREARRVLKPTGRLLLIDFGKPRPRPRFFRLHRHGHVDMSAIGAMLVQNGFEVIETGAVGTKNLNYLRALPTIKALSPSI